MPYTEIGTVEDKDGNQIQARWDVETGVVQVRVFVFPINKPAHWKWMSVGIANSMSLAIMAAQNWVRGVK